MHTSEAGSPAASADGPACILRRCHGDQVGWEGQGEEKEEEEEVKLSLRHTARRESLKGRAKPDGTTTLTVTPRRTARLAEESRQSMWRDSTLPGAWQVDRAKAYSATLQ